MCTYSICLYNIEGTEQLVDIITMPITINKTGMYWYHRVRIYWYVLYVLVPTQQFTIARIIGF